MEIKGCNTARNLVHTLLILIVSTAAQCPGLEPPLVPSSLSPTPQPTGPQTTPVMAPPTMAPAKGGTAVVLLAVDSIVTLDPAAYSDRPTETVIRNVFDGLVTRNADNEVVLELAQSATRLNDTTWEFKLKQGITFHNGDPLTADDVVFTFQRILTQDIGAQRRGFVSGVDSITRVDDHTVRFHLKSPWPIFMQMLVHNQIVPQRYLTEVGDEGFARKPIGCGPFKFVSGQLDDEIVLERYEGYYGGADALPPVSPAPLEKAVFKMVPSPDARVEALLAGEADIIQDVPPYMVGRLLSDTHIQVRPCAGTSPKFIDLNVKMPPFDDVRVRQALNYAVDVDALLAQVQGGYGTPLPGPLSPANNYVREDLVPYGYDKTRALGLLGEAGWVVVDDDGTLGRDREEKLSFTIDAYGDYVAYAEAVARQLRGLGMDVSVRSWEYDVIRPKLLAGERQAFLRDWGDSIFDPVGYVEAKWHTYVEGTPLGRANYAQYANPRVDRLIEEGARESNPAKRHVIYDELQRIIYDDAPAVFLFVPQRIEASSSRIRNWAPSHDGRINLHDVWISGE